MKLYDLTSGPERLPQIKADCSKTPLDGSIEFLPLCNMDCRMCDVRKAKANLTGGEPLFFQKGGN